MVEFKTKTPEFKFLVDGKIEISFKADKSILKAFDGVDKEKEFTINIKEYRKKRTLSQNAYLWVLLDEIGKKLRLNKEQVYKSYIKDYGIFEVLPIKNEAVDRFTNNWAKNGLGWFTQELGKSKLDGYTNLIAYYGTSTYNTQELNRVLDAIIEECKELGIQTLTKEEISLLQNDNG